MLKEKMINVIRIFKAVSMEIDFMNLVEEDSKYQVMQSVDFNIYGYIYFY